MFAENMVLIDMNTMHWKARLNVEKRYWRKGNKQGQNENFKVQVEKEKWQ